MLHESDTDAFGETAASSWDADRVATDPRVFFATRAAHARARFAGAVDARGAARVEYALLLTNNERAAAGGGREGIVSRRRPRARSRRGAKRRRRRSKETGTKIYPPPPRRATTRAARAARRRARVASRRVASRRDRDARAASPGDARDAGRRAAGSIDGHHVRARARRRQLERTRAKKIARPPPLALGRAAHLVALMMAAMALVVYETARTTPRVSARV